MVKKIVEGIMNKAIKNVTLQHCIQYADDTENENTVTCRRLEFKNFHDYKKYNPRDCDKDMVNFFVKGVGRRNKGKSTGEIIREMSNGLCDSPYVFNREDSNRPIESGREIFLKKQQKLVPRLINPQTNLKGLLVYHGLGSGKTGTSIIVGEACKHISTNMKELGNGSDRSQRRVLVVVPASLKDQFKQEILGNLIHRKSKVDKNVVISEIKKKIKNINVDTLISCFNRNASEMINNSFTKNVLINDVPQKYMTISRAVSYESKRSQKYYDSTILERVNKTYKVVSRQTFMKHFLISNEIYSGGQPKTKTITGYCIKDFLMKPNGLLIIDEIQNLISETGSWYKNLMRGIKYYCHPTTKILLLTATPIYDKIFELGLTINLLNPRIRFPETRKDFDKLFVATSEDELKDEETRGVSRDVSERKSIFLSRKERIEKYSEMVKSRNLTSSQVEEEFEITETCYNQLSTFLSDVINKNEMLSISNYFHPKLKQMIKSINGMTDFPKLFDIAQDLKKRLGLNDYRNSVIKNKDLFEYMCSGYISYFKGGNPEGFPEKITKIIDCRMDSSQADAYIDIVKMEVKKNRDAEASKKLNPNSIQQGTYFQKATMTSNVHLVHKIQGNDKDKRIKELLNKILNLEVIKRLIQSKPNEDVIGQISSMNIYELSELYEEINVDSIHHSQNEAEVEEEEKDLFDKLKNIPKKYSKNRLKVILEERKRMTQEYYKATLSVIKDEIKVISNELDKIRHIHTKYSCKFAKMIDKILKEENEEGKHFVYSRFKTRGVECLSYMLEGFGFKRYTEDNISNLMKDVNENPKLRGKCFTVWSGDITDKTEFSKVFKSIYNHRDNREGNYLKIVLGTESIMEGVNLKEVKYVHITEPWWNESRMDQVMGRAIRWKSHIKMPKKDRKVIIYRYYAITDLNPKNFSPEIQPLASSTLQTSLVNNALDRANLSESVSNILRENRDWKIHELENPEPISPLAFSSIDRYIQGVAEKKKRLNQMFYKSIKNSAIDCLFNKSGNTYRLEKEFYYDEDKPPKEYFYDPTEHKYYDTMKSKELTKEIYGNTLEIKEKYDKLELKEIEEDKGIYYENINCNFSRITGKAFEKFLNKNKFSYLLNTESRDKIKEIIFNIYNNRTTDDSLTRIKINFQNCLLEKIRKQNPEADINKIISIFNDPGKKSIKAKIIENIMIIFTQKELQQLVDVENNKRENQGKPSMGPQEEEDFKHRNRDGIEKSLSHFKTKLWQVESVSYLKEQEKYLGIGTLADNVYKDLLKGLDKHINRTVFKNPTISRRGRRRPPSDDTFGNPQRFNQNDPSMWVGSSGWEDNPAYDKPK